MVIWNWTSTQRLLVCMIAMALSSIFSACFSASSLAGEVNQKHQELSGVVEDGRGNIYALKDLRKGETLSAYMENTGGNLDPVLGILKKGTDRKLLREALMKGVKESDLNLIEASRRFAEQYFQAWDDDSGVGYDARLEFTIPADGTYLLFAGSMITNQDIFTFSPHLTSGSYRIRLRIGSSPVETEKIASADGEIATIASEYVAPLSSVQKLDHQLSADNSFTFHHLRKVQPGETVYARLESNNEDPLPRMFLSDQGGKPLLFAAHDSPTGAATISYSSKEGDDGLILYIDASSLDISATGGQYRLTAGINAPEVIDGRAKAHGLPLIKTSADVTIGLSIDQIVNVDQQNETFAVVASLQLVWQEPVLAFSPDKCNCSIKKMKLSDLKSLSVKHNFVIPEFTIFNQQGNRWAQNQIVYIEPSGRITYLERFTVTLQAPDFDFSTYPFDRQQFKVRVDLNVPTEIFTFRDISQPSAPLGDELGEEEWTVANFFKTIEEIPFGKNLKKSRFTMTMEVDRHLNYYLFRIFMPLLLIITISWVIFFLNDYGRQLEVASGNLLVFVAFNFAISNDLPRLGYLTLLDRMIITSFVCAAMVVLISVYQKRLETKGKVEKATHIDKVVLTFYPLVYVSLIVLEYFVVTQ